jgi:hypothetical protein
MQLTRVLPISGPARSSVLLVDVKNRIRTAQIRASLPVNPELIQFLSQLVREIDGENLPRAAADIPWGHNMVLIFKLKDPAQ